MSMKLRFVEREVFVECLQLNFTAKTRKVIKVLQYQEELGRAWVDVPLEVEEVK